jgi:tetratricopeptide (TPR) repeat protein
VQDEIARAIAERLKVTLEEAGLEPLVKAGTKNLEAYQAYVKGRALLYRRGAGLPRALECFRLAVALDPGYAQAWADVADAHVMLAYYGFGRPDPLLSKAKETATRAVALDPTLAAGHNALAGAYALADWDWSKSESEFRRAIELDPRSILARTRYALWCVLPASSRFEEAIAEVKEAAEMDPLSDYAATILAFTYYVAGKPKESLQMAQHAMELEPESFLARLSLGLALHSQTRYEEAVTAIEMGLAMSGRHPMFLAFLAVTLADASKLQEAKLVHTEFLARSARDYLSPFLVALSAAAIGDQEAAIGFAQTAFEIHDPQLTIFGKYWPGSKRLREDRRFEKILAAMGLK